MIYAKLENGHIRSSRAPLSGGQEYPVDSDDWLSIDNGSIRILNESEMRTEKAKRDAENRKAYIDNLMQDPTISLIIAAVGNGAEGRIRAYLEGQPGLRRNI